MPGMTTESNQALENEIAAIIEAVDIESPLAFLFAGRRIQTGDPYWPASPGPASLVAILQQQIYAQCYIKRFDPSKNAAMESNPMRPETDISAALQFANASQDRWDSNWQIARVLPGGQLWVWKNDRCRWPVAGEFMTHEGPGIPPRPGSMVSLLAPRGSATMQPGFYFAFGQTLLDAQDDLTDILRFYLNVRDVAAPTLVANVTATLNEFQIPFRFKCLNNRALFPRRDAAVLFVHKRFFRIVAALLIEIGRRLGDHLGEDVPLFSKRLAPGIGLAEDPSSAPLDRGNATPTPVPESFGSHRSRLLAEAIFAGFTAGAGKSLQFVLDQLSRRGISVEKPYLNAGSPDVYDIPERN
jgi:hypothetical protein